MPETYINATEHGTTDTRTILAKLAELLPSGTGYVRILADGTLTLDTPVGGSGAPPFREKLTVTATNVLSQLSYTPRTGTVVKLTIRGLTHSSLSGDFTVVGKDITVNAGGYSIPVGWIPEAEYYTDDTITPPTITSFAPTSASVGTVLTITGTGFFGVQSVTVGGVVQTTYTVNSATQITVTLAAGSYSTNTVVVITASGAASLAGFTYLDPTPTITALSATISAIGNPVIITGTNFTGASSVLFGGVNAASFVVNSATQITATIADTGAAGTVQALTPFGTATSAASITLDTMLTFPRVGRFMTANATVIGGLNYTASASSFAFAGREAYRAFSSNGTDFWLGATANNEWLGIQLPLRARVRRYELTTASVNNNHHPKNWLFQGWDGSTWVTLDTKINQTLTAGTLYSFPITNNVYYSEYRAFVQDTNLAGWAVAIGKLVLLAA